MASSNLFSIDAPTTELLNQALTPLAKNKNKTFVCLNIFGPQVLIRQFEFPGINDRELKNALRLEAVELLHIADGEVELDYQLFIKTKDTIKGIFIAAPKPLVKEQLAACDHHKVTPVMMTARILSVINAFLDKNRVIGKNFCLIDFSKDNIIHLVVFDGDTCLLVREIHYDNKEEAEREVINSLKYSCAKSTFKQLNRIYVSGDILDKEGWMERLKKEFDVAPKFAEFTSAPECYDKKSFFKLNLLKARAVTFSARNQILLGMNIILTILVAAFLMKGLQSIKQERELKRANASFSQKSYERAQELLNQTKILADGK